MAAREDNRVNTLSTVVLSEVRCYVPLKLELQLCPHTTIVEGGKHIVVKVFTGLVHPDFKFFQRDTPSPEIDFLNGLDCRFPTVFFSQTKLSFEKFVTLEDGTKKRLETFQFKIRNLVAIQFGIAKEKDYIENDRHSGLGVGDNPTSYGFDPIHGVAWHKRARFAYGEPCEVGDIVRCTVDWDAQTVSFQRMRGDESNPENLVDFGVAFSDISKENNLKEMVPAISMGRYQCIQFAESECTKNLYTDLNRTKELRVESAWQIHAFYNQEYLHKAPLPDHVFKDPDALHNACIMGHKDIVFSYIETAKQQKDVETAKQPDYSLFTKRNSCTYTAIHMCVQARQPDCLKLLLDNLPPDLLYSLPRTESKCTPLHITGRFGAFACGKLLLERDEFRRLINEVDKRGDTGLDSALCNEHMLVAEQFIRYGANKVSKGTLERVARRFDSFLLLLKHAQAFTNELIGLSKIDDVDPFMKDALQKKFPNANYTPLPNSGEVTSFIVSLEPKVQVCRVVIGKSTSMYAVLYSVARAMKAPTTAVIRSFKPYYPESKKVGKEEVYPYIENVKLLLKQKNWHVCRRDLESELQEELTAKKKGSLTHISFGPIVPM